MAHNKSVAEFYGKEGFLMARFVTTTWSTDEDWNGDCDYAVIEIDPAYARELVRKHEKVLILSREEPNLSCVKFLDYGCTFHENDPEEEKEIDSVIESISYQVGERQATDYSRVCFNDEDCWWQAGVKHTSLMVESQPISMKRIREIASEDQ
jgi:hypothetical protein